MKEVKYYKLAIVALVILNLGMLTFFFLTRPKLPPPSKEGGEMLRQSAVKILELDEVQTQQFLELAAKHHRQMQQISHRQGSLLEPYFESLVQATDERDTLNLVRQVQAAEKQKIEMTYRHLSEVNDLLRPDQKDNFAPFLNQSLRVILLKGRKRPIPPKD